jgi:dipeptide transport system ATP-binding protein
VLNLLDLQQDMGIAYLFISHNLQVVRHITENVAVLYLGKIVELTETLVSAGRRIRTRALLASTPSLRNASRRVAALPIATLPEVRETEKGTRRAATLVKGEPPSPLNPPSGCTFHGRCPYAIERCRIEVPLLEAFDGALVACHRVAEINT